MIAAPVIAQLGAIGIDLKEVTAKLQADGLSSFVGRSNPWSNPSEAQSVMPAFPESTNA